MKPKLKSVNLPYGTIHKPTIKAKKRIHALKKELFEIYQEYYRSLEDSDKEIVDILMDDNTFNPEVR